MKGKTFVTAVCAAALVSAAVLASLADGGPRAAPIFYETALVTEGEVQKVVATTGTVRPRMTVQVGSEVSGRVKTINVDFNAQVKEGDLLAVIDPKTFDSKHKQAKADLMAAEASLASNEAAQKKANSILQNAERAFARQRTLDQKGIAAGAAVDSAERDLGVARAEVEVSTANRQSAQALVAQKRALLDQAMIDLERTQIRSPVAGVVLHRAVDVGQTVAASFQAPELFRLAGDLRLIHIEAQVGESDIGAVRTGQPVVFEVDAHQGRTFKGSVEQIRLSPASADSVVTYTVIIEAQNPKLELFPGMTANVRIETARRDGVARLSADAVRFKPPKQAKAISGNETWLDRGRALARGVLLAAGVSGSAGSADQQSPVEPAAKIKDADEASLQRWVRRLGLDQSQSEALKARLAEAKSPATKAAKGKRDKATAAIDDDANPTFEAFLVTILRPDQAAKLKAHREEREGTHRATVFVLGKDGSPERRSVRIGLADTKFVELASKELKVGDAVIVRSRKEKAP